jgi:hypothetical protein
MDEIDNQDDRVKLPMLGVNVEEGDPSRVSPSEPFFLVEDYTLNAYWKLAVVGNAIILTEPDITIVLNGGSFDDGADWHATLSCVGVLEVDEEYSSLIYADAPAKFGGKFSPAMLAQFLNNLIYMLLTGALPSERLELPA